VVDWRPAAGGGVEVGTADGAVAGSAHLVLASGPWVADHVPDLRLPLAVERQPVCWFTPVVPVDEVSAGRLPIWLMDTPDGGTFYGFPFDPELGLKVSHHHSGEIVAAETVDREVRPADGERIRTFIRARMPAAAGPLSHATVCLYTNTPDDEFVIDRHPAVQGVAFASACSGHGFKFAPIVGEILADLATTGSTAWPADPFRWDRFAAD
jgi:sarcosine oxidase